jgi:F-type H+-transporting ATPase subunit epsilon
MSDPVAGGAEARGGAMRVVVVTPERTLYDGRAGAVVAPAYDGLVGILPRHAPFLSLLGTGPLVVRAADGDRRFTVSGGFVQVVDNVVRLVAEQAEAAAAA